MLNVNQIRKDFPIFTRLINGKPIVYLDSTATSFKPLQVIRAVEKYYTYYSANIFRGLYQISEEATQAYEEARVKVATFIGCSDSREVIFVRNATEGINLVARTWGITTLEVGDEILTTVMEHHANIVPWQVLARERSCALSYVNITKDGKLDLEEVEKKINKKTKLFAFTYISNVLGSINQVKEIIERVKKINPEIVILIDAAQAVPHISLDIASLGCDFLVFSGHKMCGPTGIGALWGKYELLSEIPPYQYGGEMIREVYKERSLYKDPPHKFEAGTPDISGAIGLGEAVQYIQTLGMDAIHTHEQEITKYALEKLVQVPDCIVYGPHDYHERGGIISFGITGIHPHDIAQVLDEENICIRSGHHCAMLLHKELGVEATARASFYIYNDKEDVDALVEGLKKTIGILKK